MTYTLQKVGSDAEVFLLSPITKDIIPICGLIGGTKENPLPVLDTPGFAIQEDNVLFEFNIPPASTAEEFQHNMQRILQFVVKKAKSLGFDIRCSSIELLKNEYLQSPQANQFGCDPDFDVYHKKVNPAPGMKDLIRLDSAGNARGELRCAGTHIHVSFLVDDNPPTLEDVEQLVKVMDMFVGVPLSGFDDSERRNYYGRPGCFRLKPYGLEYRVLGSKILGNDPIIFDYIFSRIVSGIAYLNANSPDAVSSLLQELANYVFEALIGHGMTAKTRRESVMNYLHIPALALPLPTQQEKSQPSKKSKPPVLDWQESGNIPTPLPTANYWINTTSPLPIGSQSYTFTTDYHPDHDPQESNG